MTQTLVHTPAIMSVFLTSLANRFHKEGVVPGVDLAFARHVSGAGGGFMDLGHEGTVRVHRELKPS
jgi:hypothetical protein